ncbi:MAG: ABC transporter ATP-binding protein [Dehalococcoidia bacterium]|nr:ABC transporter ATP-binding protein [Dehalococcoidia bacterium]
MLKTIDLKVKYDGAEALRGISIEVEDRGIVALIGPNGAGKTTTLRCISGLVSPDSGEIWFRDKRIDGMPPHKIVSLGLAHVAEDKKLFPFMTVAENLMMGAYLRHDRACILGDIDSVYQLFPILRDRRTQKAGTLSGGEQQMLSIARALMSRPQLLMLDEPSLGLSPRLVSQVAAILRQVHERGIAVLLVEQNARLAFSLAEKVYLLETGKVVLSGRAESIQDMARVSEMYLGGHAGQC